jgi:hypothetical protein
MYDKGAADHDRARKRHNPSPADDDREQRGESRQPGAMMGG